MSKDSFLLTQPQVRLTAFPSHNDGCCSALGSSCPEECVCVVEGGLSKCDVV